MDLSSECEIEKAEFRIYRLYVFPTIEPHGGNQHLSALSTNS